MLMDGLIALVSGMGFVFLVLILISVIISLFQYIEKPKKVKSQEVKQEVIIQEKPAVESTTDDLELVAVITGAIAASLNTTTDKLLVKSFRKINSKW